MSVLDFVGATTAISKLLLKGLELIDPKTRDWVNKRKALEWGEKYIFCDEEIKVLKKKPIPLMTFKERKKILYLEKKLKYYRKWFFEYS